MKKIIALLLALMMVLSICASCGEDVKTTDTSSAAADLFVPPVSSQTEADKDLYKDAVKALSQTELKLDGTPEISEDLVIAIQNAEYTEPKNFIYMIGDGMGFNIVEVTRAKYEDSLYQKKLAINQLPVQSSQATYSADAQVTDSAAGGTALATGFKTSNQTVAMTHDDTESYKTLLELAAEKGKSTGIVATSNVVDATPASFTAHVADRYMSEGIAKQQLEKVIDGTLDVVLGGGRNNYNSVGNKATLQAAKDDASATYIEDWSEAANAKMPLIGLFAQDHLDTHDENTPSIAQMTDLAIDLLSQDENGFFLMVEGSQIDKKAHNNNFDDEVKEMIDFDCAITVAMRFVALNPDTVLIVTADHETGGLEISADATSSNYGSHYTTGNHTYKPVPVAAAGKGTEVLLGINENIDLPRFVAKLLGEENFGEPSQVNVIRSTFTDKDIKALANNNSTLNNHTLVEKTKDGALAIHFNNAHNQVSFPAEVLKTNELPNGMRAIHMIIKNTGNKTVMLPHLVAKVAFVTETLVPQVAYISGNTTMRVTYILPNWAWTEKSTEAIKEFTLKYSEGMEINLEINNLAVVTRADNK